MGLDHILTTNLHAIRHALGMFLGMRMVLGASILAAILAAASPSASARPTSHRPSAAQIRAAVSRAKRSRVLWATVNICDTRRDPNTMGIRGQMPSLGFTAGLYMNIQFDYWSAKRKRFEPISGLSKLVALGELGSGVRQGGASIPFTPPTGRLSGTVTFEWKLGARLVGQTSRSTKAGHQNADFGSPPHFSASVCTIT